MRSYHITQMKDSFDAGFFLTGFIKKAPANARGFFVAHSYV